MVNIEADIENLDIGAVNIEADIENLDIGEVDIEVAHTGLSPGAMLQMMGVY